MNAVIEDDEGRVAPGASGASGGLGEPGGGGPGGPDAGDPLVEFVPAKRARGLWVLTAVVLAGLVPTSVYFHWKVPGVIEDFQELVRESKQRTPTERLALWFQMNQPQVHNRLRQFRLSAEQPWLVAFGVGPGAQDAPVEVWGIDFTAFPAEAIELDDASVRVVLAQPANLGVHALGGSQAINVPRYATLAGAPDPTERVFDLVEYALRHPDDFLEAFTLDNPGMSFRLRVGDVERVLASSPSDEP